MIQDKNHVYADGKIIPVADVKTFQTLGAKYARDQARVYYRDTLLEGANPATFRVTYDDRYFTVGGDGVNLYQSGRSVKRLPPEKGE